MLTSKLLEVEEVTISSADFAAAALTVDPHGVVKNVEAMPPGGPRSCEERVPFDKVPYHDGLV